jgi:tyrosinase
MAKERPDIETLISEHTQELQKPQNSRQVTRLEKLIIAFQKVQDTPPSKGDLSYFYLSSYHGLSSVSVFETQRKDVPRQFKTSRFCPHGLPEFPAWHRVYLSKFEKALQAQDPSVMLPFWNEISPQSQATGYPSLFSETSFMKTDGTSIRNPLESFRTTENIDFRGVDVEDPQKTNRDSGSLVSYTSRQLLSDVKSAFKQTTYELFSYNSNTSPLSVENPHNNIHGYIGGWMGSVELSAFDPIFWFHHCFIDNLFWQWQKLNNQTSSIKYSRIHLQLVPFRKPSSTSYYTIEDIAGLDQFGYTYGQIDLQALGQDSRNSRFNFFNNLGRPKVEKTEGSKKILVISGIRFADFGGSFRVEVNAGVASGNIPVGTQTVFRFSKECVNCDVSPSTHVSFRLKDVPQSEESRIRFKVTFVVSSGSRVVFTEDMEPGSRVIHRIMGSALQLVY